VEADVLVGADGLYSRVRARLAGRERLEPPVYSGTSCWRGFFAAEGVPLPAQYSWQELWGRGVRFGWFDVGGGRRSFYAFANLPPDGEDKAHGGTKAHLKRLFQDLAEPVGSIIDRLDEEAVYRDDIFDRQPPGAVWGRGAVTLLGDAAHPSLPTLGQGGCMAIEDAFELAKRLRSAESRWEQMLRDYEASRYKRVGWVVQMSRQVARLAQAQSPWACRLRDTLYRLTPVWLGDLQFRWLFDYRPGW
jgi:2-polyprenyl-6-methoxyphenol hydroxylase-like FAD-dependent oxidoreductase